MDAGDGQVPVNLVQKRRCQLKYRGYLVRRYMSWWWYSCGFVAILLKNHCVNAAALFLGWTASIGLRMMCACELFEAPFHGRLALFLR
jgi:hypothetical protein